MKKHIYTLSILALAVLAVGIIGVSAQITGGQSSGWAWSSTIGWVSASSTQSGAGGGGPYSLTVNSSGVISGYLWSSNIGWIYFNDSDVAGCPVVPANGICGPRVNLSTGAVTGWAMALSGKGRTDGWDGWIELSGANHPSIATQSSSGPSSSPSPSSSGSPSSSSSPSPSPSSAPGGGVYMNPSTGAFSGYAWGGPVVGWLQFDIPGSNGQGIIINNCPGGNCGSTVSISSCSASPLSLSSNGGGVKVTATVTNVPASSGYKYRFLDGTGNYSSYTALSQGDNTVNYTFNYPSNTNKTDNSYSPGVAVYDSTGKYIMGSTANQCGTVIVSGTQVNNTYPVSLNIGVPGNATRTSLNLSVGQKFELAWANSLSGLSDYTCYAQTNSGWSSGWGAGPSGSAPFDTTGAKAGTYTFSIYCQYTGVPGGGNDTYSNDGNPVILNLNSSSESEK
ncbi:MAG: hypothetical protein KGI49_00125 [Patescibacteria group bacterium]|nr:hypothetical protein [Patescibacteria group bacterium]